MLKKVKVGDVFSRLTAIKYIAGSAKLDTRAKWECSCECGNIHVTDSSRLKKGTSKMCRPCSDIESGKTRSNAINKTTNPKEYGAWSSMKNRCSNKNYDGYHRYGGRGIVVCNSWNESFESFLLDMGCAPSILYSIDRIDNNKDYYKENCKWSTMEEQQNNRHTNVYLTIDEERKTIAQWCRELSISYEMVRARLKRGWSEYDAVMTDVGKKPNQC